MAFSFSNLSSYHTNTKTVGGSPLQSFKQQANVASSAAVNELKSMNPGETFVGEVVAVDGDEVIVRMDENAVFSAKLEQAVSMSVGQSIIFEISNKANGQVALRTLFTNLAQEHTAMNALSQAGMDVTPSNLSMVSNLMEESMPIDKQTLQNVYRDIASYPKAEISDIVSMHKLGIKVDEATLEQFGNFKNLENKVSVAIDLLAESIPESFASLISEGKEQTAIQLYADLFDMISQTMSDDSSLQQKNGMVPTSEMSRLLSEEEMNLIKASIFIKDEVILNEEGSLEHPERTIPQTDETMKQKNVTFLAEERIVSKQGEIIAAKDETKGNTDGAIQSEQETNSMTSFKDSSINTQRLLYQLSQELALPKEVLQSIKEGTISEKELLLSFSEALRGVGISSDKLTAFLSGKDFDSLMKELLKSQWLLKPEEVMKAENVKELFSRLSQHISTLQADMANYSSIPQNLVNQLNHLNENVDFINQLNQFATYVQIPLKMNGKSATGDLYVYTDKKSLAAKDGNVTALLHLDMQNLGPMDIFVEMESNKHIKTNFKVCSDEILDFIKDHIFLLDERLNKRGYQLDVNLSKMEEPVKVCDEMLAHKKTGEMSGTNLAAHYRFDVRA